MISLLRPTFAASSKAAFSRPAFAPTRFGAVRAFSLSRPILSQTPRRYTEDHEWTSYEPSTNIATIGVTDYAQKALGDVVFVELPEVGNVVEKGEECGSIESVKAASEIYAPLSGEVREVNSSLDDQPGLVNKSALEKGWLFKIHLTNPGEYESLLSEEAYKAMLE